MKAIESASAILNGSFMDDATSTDEQALALVSRAALAPSSHKR
jgi:hypothetical protein